MKPRLHLVALPHVRLGTPTTHLCAYSGKVVKFCKMMSHLYDITLYAPESDPVEGATLVSCLSDEGRVATFGADDDNRLPAWPTDEQSASFNQAAIVELRKWVEPRDLILLSGGYTHFPVAQAFRGSHIVVEPFVGYEGVIGGNVHAAYESYFHMAQIAWKMGFKDIRWYDRVIHPFCDPDEFPILNNGNGDYLLFVGRLISRKGPHVALQIAQACGMPLYVAGAGGRMEGHVLIGQDVWLEGNHVYHGPVSIEKRAKLMAGAKALLAPTIYSEPGGNIAIEAQMAGTPVIAPDWGVFAETIEDCKTGFHFRTLKQAVEGVIACPALDPNYICQRAMALYSLDAISLKFQDWCEDLGELWGDGWNTL